MKFTLLLLLLTFNVSQAFAQGEAINCSQYTTETDCNAHPPCFWHQMGSASHCMLGEGAEEEEDIAYHIMYNQHFVRTRAEGPRGGTSLTAPGMVPHITLTDRLGDSQTFFDTEIMLTLDPFLVGNKGTVLLGQVGEHQPDGAPYLDRQHPHGGWGPLLMAGYIGLKHKLKSGDVIFVNWGPRSEAAFSRSFMHDLPEQVNPFAPRGHHQAQESRHQSSNVTTAGYIHGNLQIDGSIHSGREPIPYLKTDTAIHRPDSFTLRAQFSPLTWVRAGVSFGKMKLTHGDGDQQRLIDFNVYAETNRELPKGITWDSMNMWGREQDRDREVDKVRNSFKQANLFRFNQGKLKNWALGTRFEVVRRNPNELVIHRVDDHGEHGHDERDFTMVSFSTQVIRRLHQSKSGGLNVDAYGMVDFINVPSHIATFYGGSTKRQWSAGVNLNGMFMGEKKKPKKQD